MFLKIVPRLKKAFTIFADLLGWSLLILLWYKMMFLHKEIIFSLNALKAITWCVFIIYLLYYIWNNINLRRIFFHNNAIPEYIPIKASSWVWAEITFDANDKIISSRERYTILCMQKENNLSSTRKLSYSALLIRDGFIIQAIGFLRPIINDPYVGQLTRKIVRSELDLIYTDGSIINKIKGCSIMNSTIQKTDNPFQIALLGYNRNKVDEFMNELMLYCWNLEKENSILKSDLADFNSKTQLNHIFNASNAKLEEKEYSLLLGLKLQENLLDYAGNKICEKDTIVTTQLIEYLISKGLYGELVAAADSRKGVETIVR